MKEATETTTTEEELSNKPQTKKEPNEGHKGKKMANNDLRMGFIMRNWFLKQNKDNLKIFHTNRGSLDNKHIRRCYCSLNKT